ncbi:uncharacterized protein TRAVEDRAFT_70123 [Trametes versicolor FP-101664 SS1]|uniref:uncharacterized protein n=1 Tax=Trametes versicolor (strain FP-101664) TaxID=717944 RepID=UPI00046245E8|nr:uncharacterized protein TRAVEDRAFT_70123 [Trametes versicolor FP-101664 SS1]EIW61879.1 hypothetical protein TRAVEDRAFT_70123 [Trametes versicolor FP-101664 SS1]
MPLRPSTIYTMEDYHDHQAAQFKKWADLIKDDPRRVCRALALYTPRGETLEGDSHDDVPILFQQLKEASNESTSKSWKGLVDAGVITALCKCAINTQATLTLAYATVNDEGVAEISQECMDLAQENAPAPYSPALEVLCNAAMSCARPATSTEQKMVAEMKQYWSSIMQRLWSEPSRTLDHSGNAKARERERVAPAQIVHRLSSLDPTFLDIILKPSDLTLAVCFRYWLYSTSEWDDIINCTLITPLLDGVGPDHWNRYFAEHPRPDMHALLPRILLGASRGTGKKKRTPNQSAEFIVDVFAKHFRQLGPRELLEEIIFFNGLLNATEKEFLPFWRALYRSEPFWTAMAQNVTRYAPLGPNAPKTGHIPEGLTMVSLKVYFNVLHGDSRDALNYIDELLCSWFAGGLFDALESAITTIVRSIRGPMFLSVLIQFLDNNLHNFNPKTREKLRAELPRPRLMIMLIMLSTKGSQNVDDLLASVAADESVAVPRQDPRHPQWAVDAWRLLLRLTNTLRPFRGTCTRRGCDEPAYKGGCGKCKLSAYCGQECIRLDKDHKFICRWVPTLIIVEMLQKRDPEEVAKLLGDGVAPPPPADLPSREELLRRVREEGSMTEEEIQMVLSLRDVKDEAQAAKADDPPPGEATLQKKMQEMLLEDSSSSSSA